MKYFIAMNMRKQHLHKLVLETWSEGHRRLCTISHPFYKAQKQAKLHNILFRNTHTFAKN